MAANNEKTFLEWSHKVYEELVSLNTHVASLDEKQDQMGARFDNRLLALEVKLESMNKILLGNGTPDKGLLVRVDRLEQKNVENIGVRMDRLEQSEGRRAWLFRTTLVTSLGAIIAAVFNYLRANGN